MFDGNYGGLYPYYKASRHGGEGPDGQRLRYLVALVRQIYEKVHATVLA